MLQIDALAYSDLRRALDGGRCPTIQRLLDSGDYTLRRWFCGLPSATPYCQAGIFHGENDGIPAFRFYDKAARRVITCNAPEGVQYIRDRITSPGALAGGSSYVNLLDGDARTVAFTVATRERLSVYQRLGGTRMGVLMLVHPVRLLRMVFQAVAEWFREDVERTLGELRRRYTHSEGIFPFIRVLSNVVVRELQTIAIRLDVYLGVPVIYSTFMQYDELAHHFGPSSRQALSDLRRTDARIAEILRMARSAAPRPYEIVILSDHGMTPARSYRVLFGESLGATVQKLLDADARRSGEAPSLALDSHASDSEYADIGAQVVETVAQVASPRPGVRGALRSLRDWVRSRYGLREIIFPEKYRVDARHDVVVTYSSCLALLYFADAPTALTHADVAADARRAGLYASLLAHPGVGLLLTRGEAGAVHAEGRGGRALLLDGQCSVLAGDNPLERYGTEPHVVRAIARLVSQPNAGDIVLFGAYDGYDIVSFDDQVGAHGSAGGDQTYPFIIGPTHLELDAARLVDASDLHAAVLMKYRDAQAPEPGT